jgi:hypothetical protein
MSLCHGEDSAELVLEFVYGPPGDLFVEASQFVSKLDERIVRFV